MLKDEELFSINGGAFSTTVAGFIIDALNYIADLGRYFGSAISHLFGNSKC